MRKKYTVFGFVSLLLIVVDQVTKFLITSNFDNKESKEVISKFFYLHYVRNTGSAFSFLADKSWGIYVLSFISLIMALLIAYLSYKAINRDYKLTAVSGLLLFSGAVGNLIDRFRLNYVVDFLRIDFLGKKLPLFGETFPIFNFADICAVCGTFLLIFVVLFKSNQIDGLIDDIFKKNKEQNGTTVNE